MTTEALLFLGELDPERIGPSLEHATHYSPTPIAEANALLDAVPLDARRTTFVDVGAGLGRVVLLAARRPYKTVIGVEISPALAHIARENVEAANDPRRVARDVRIVRADAATYTFPRGDLVVYLFNPFAAPVLERVVAALCAPARGASAPAALRNVVLLYHTPVERETIEASGAFELIHDFGFGLVYRLRPA